MHQWDFAVGGATQCNMTKGAFDLTQRCADRSNSDLKQCMPVRNLVWLELAPTPRHGHMLHQSTVRAFREQPAQFLQRDCWSADDDTAVSRLAKFTTWQQWHVFPIYSDNFRPTNAHIQTLKNKNKSSSGTSCLLKDYNYFYCNHFFC